MSFEIDGPAELITALLTSVRDDPGLQAELGHPVRIYDQRSVDALYPYILLDQHTCQASGSAGVSGLEHRLQFVLFSRSGGARDVSRVAKVSSEAQLGVVDSRWSMRCSARWMVSEVRLSSLVDSHPDCSSTSSMKAEKRRKHARPAEPIESVRHHGSKPTTIR